MTVTKEEIEARDLVDHWIGEKNIQLDPESPEYFALVEKIQGVVKDRDLMKKHADEGWKLANKRTEERQEILGALRGVAKAMEGNIMITEVPHTFLAVTRQHADAVVKKYKPLLED